MLAEVARSPSMCVERKNKITEKRQTMKSNLKTHSLKMIRLARDKFPQGKVGNTMKVRVSDVDRGRCNSRNILGVIMEADLTKDLYKKGTKDGMFNSLYPRNKITKCAEGTFNILDVPAINVSLRECVEKASLFVSQGYRICNYKASCQNIFCSCRKSFKGKCHSCWYTPFCFYKYILFSFLTN